MILHYNDSSIFMKKGDIFEISVGDRVCVKSLSGATFQSQYIFSRKKHIYEKEGERSRLRTQIFNMLFNSYLNFDEYEIFNFSEITNLIEECEKRLALEEENKKNAVGGLSEPKKKILGLF